MDSLLKTDVSASPVPIDVTNTLQEYQELQTDEMRNSAVLGVSPIVESTLFYSSFGSITRGKQKKKKTLYTDFALVVNCKGT